MLNMSTRILSLLLAVVCTLVGASQLLGDGLIIVHNPPIIRPGHFAFAPLEVRFHKVDVTIENNVATTRVEQEFYNPNPQVMEGTYIFPIPEGASIDKFSIDVNGKMTEAELLPADKARQIYEDIVRKMRDPALLEYVGKGAFKARIFPIEGNGRKLVKLSYTQLLKPDGSLCEYVYPLNTEKFSAKPLENVSIRIDLKTDRAIRNVYCPTHSVEIKRDGASHAVAGYEERNARPDTDFKLIWSQEKDPVGLSLLTYKTGNDDGYFLLMASPGVDVPRGQIQKRNVLFVIDTSGSMAGPKLDQAKKALRFCLANLNDGDTFNIIRFSTDVETLFPASVETKKDNIDKAYAFVDAMKPIGGTAIGDALTEAATEKLAKSALPTVVIFLTDGQPTIGETNEDKLVGIIKSHSSRVFPFGIGTDINTHLLDRIADATRAFPQYVLPSEDIEVKVSSFYSKIKEPVLANLDVQFTGSATTAQLYPKALPDLYKGDTLYIFGRYKGSGTGAVTLSGMVNGEKRSFSNDVNFATDDRKYAFIPRLWATRRVGWLLDEIRLHGESKELKDEIVSLAREHGIVTPYTSYLIVEDEARRNVPAALRTQSELEHDARANATMKDWYDSSRADSSKLEKAGERAVMNSGSVNSMKESINLGQTMQNAGPMARAEAAAQVAGVGGNAFGYRVNSNYTQQAKVVNGRSFYQNANIWIDSTAQNARQPLRNRQVAFNSDDYFKLLSDHPGLAPWLSLGEQVDVVVGEELISVR